MRADTIRYDFASDNTATICPEAWIALEQANTNYAPAYGDDEWTSEVCERVREIFEIDCDVYLVFTGTAANALALSQVCQPFHGVICHERAHIQTDEAGATEFYGRGARLFLTKSSNGKIDLGEAEKLVAQQVELHGHLMRAISVAQATELGTVYTPDEVAAIGGFTHTPNVASYGWRTIRQRSRIAWLRCENDHLESGSRYPLLRGHEKWCCRGRAGSLLR
jgi:threonine aldolase